MLSKKQIELLKEVLTKHANMDFAILLKNKNKQCTLERSGDELATLIGVTALIKHLLRDFGMDDETYKILWEDVDV